MRTRLVEDDDVQPRRVAALGPLRLGVSEEAAHALLRDADELIEDLGPVHDLAPSSSSSQGGERALWVTNRSNTRREEETPSRRGERASLVRCRETRGARVRARQALEVSRRLCRRGNPNRKGSSSLRLLVRASRVIRVIHPLPSQAAGGRLRAG